MHYILFLCGSIYSRLSYNLLHLGLNAMGSATIDSFEPVD